MQLWRVEEKFYTRWRSIIILTCAKIGPRKLLKTQGTFAIKFIFNKESCRNKFKDLKSYIYSQRINSRLIHVYTVILYMYLHKYINVVRWIKLFGDGDIYLDLNVLIHTCTLFCLDLQPNMNRFIKLTFPRITLKYVYRRGKKRNKIKKVRLLNQKIFTGLFSICLWVIL